MGHSGAWSRSHRAGAWSKFLKVPEYDPVDLIGVDHVLVVEYVPGVLEDAAVQDHHAPGEDVAFLPVDFVDGYLR